MAGTVGMIHSHPKAQSCWYYFPGTQVATSDLAVVRAPALSVDAIMCGDTLVWIGRDVQERRMPCRRERRPRAPPAPSSRPGGIRWRRRSR